MSRFVRLLVLPLLLAPLSCATPPAREETPAPPTGLFSYGSAPLQYGELRLPPGPGPFPVVVGIHGGCWLDELGQGTFEPVVEAVTADGVATWNVRYRRLGNSGGGWPATFEDVGAAVDHLRVLARDHPLDLDRVVVAGHSSGAHLAAWVALRPGLPEGSPIRGVDPLPVGGAVAIDGPLDLAAFSRSAADVQICGEPVVAELLGGGPEEQPDRYRQASPAEMTHTGVPLYLTPAGMMLMLEGDDGMGPATEAMVPRPTVVPVSGSDHFQLITPGEEAWQTVRETIRTALDGARTPG